MRARRRWDRKNRGFRFSPYTAPSLPLLLTGGWPVIDKSSRRASYLSSRRKENFPSRFMKGDRFQWL